MTGEELTLAIKRHATSKLVDDNLQLVATLGFRGEALPSIASVSRFTLTSRTADADTAWTLSIDGGELGEAIPAAHPKGTRIEMRDLFYVTSHASYWAMSMFDLAVHGSTTTSSLEENDDDDEFEHVKMYKEYMKKYAKRSSVLGSDPVASWYHPAIGYDAGYYGYGWSEVYALDLFDKFHFIDISISRAQPIEFKSNCGKVV